MKTLPAMTAAVDSNPTRNARQMARAPRPLPVWMQVGVVVLLLAQGVQTAVQWSQAHASASSRVQAAPLAQFEYYYTPDNLRAQGAAQTAPQARYDYNPYGPRTTGNLSPAFQYSATYAHAPGAVSVTPMRAYDATPGRWLDRDPLPAK